MTPKAACWYRITLWSFGGKSMVGAAACARGVALTSAHKKARWMRRRAFIVDLAESARRLESTSGKANLKSVEMRLRIALHQLVGAGGTRCPTLRPAPAFPTAPAFVRQSERTELPPRSSSPGTFLRRIVRPISRAWSGRDWKDFERSC